MIKNGLNNRNREERVSKTLGIIAGGYLLLCFIAPASLPQDSVPELSGRANAFDYAFHDSWGNQNHGENSDLGHNQLLHGGTFAWTDLNVAWAIVYAIGDINCHQKYERSWEINGNQMPVCTRDVGIFFGFFVGCLIFGLRGANRWTIRDTFLSIFPDSKISYLYERDLRLHATYFLIFIGLLPMAIDGFTQLFLDSYESNNPLRLITGFFAGAVLGWWFSSALSARPALFQSSQDVILPSGAKLVSK